MQYREPHYIFMIVFDRVRHPTILLYGDFQSFNPQKVTIIATLVRRMIESQNLTSTNAINSTSSLSTESITGIIFGICATVGSIVTIRQAHRAWKIRHKKSVTKLTRGASYELVETSTFGTGQLSITITEAPPSALSPPAILPSLKAPEACITPAGHCAGSRPLALSDLGSIPEQIGFAESQVMTIPENPPNARLTALTSALERLDMPLDELQASDYTRQPYTQARNSRLSTLKAAISQLSSSFDNHESGPTPPKLIGDDRALATLSTH